MGRAKDLMMQEEEQGWGLLRQPDLLPLHLRSLPQRLHQELSHRLSLQLLQAPAKRCAERVMEIIGNTVADYYNRAVNEAPYESAEGGYQGVTYDTDQVMDDIVGDISRPRGGSGGHQGIIR